MSGVSAVFLDRDGVLNRRPADHCYVTKIEDLQLLPGVAQGIRELRRGGFTPIVVSNQRGVSLGELDMRTLREIEAELKAAGADVEAFYYCTHDLGDRCDCRKPLPGLLLRAASEWGLSLPDSLLIGDSESDIEAGIAAGCHTIRVASGPTRTRAEYTASDLRGAAHLAVARWGTAQPP